ncbi:MAG: peptidylprolyl isomerase [Gammaproteobacteria bacterium]|nr:peptidylprolyl isomerase [Gammaproteobacteria bacterium]MCW8910994.1 peptidylprolyl isomerase [Gammaproteobacteria bacterium]MCW9004331.1 peptidylprolyl isomerase [Gammaproteobacteria bacterium]MCW9056816.1 peptidylprolyl isomerase [Gammaproteobacteria bacterium]
MKLKTFVFTFLLISISINSYALQQLDRIIVVVNDDVITESEFKKKISFFERQLAANNKKIHDKTALHKQILERLILDEIQMQLAATQGIIVDDIMLNRIIEDLARSNKLTLEQLRKSIIKEGQNFEDFREQTRNEFTVQQLQKRMVYDRINISAQEIEQFIEQQKKSGAIANDKYHIGHILIATPEAATPEDIQAAHNRATKIYDSLIEGESFNDVALRESEGQQALKGGDLGWRSPAELPPLFVNAIKKLKKSGVSPPLRSAGGFHIIKLIDIQTQQHLVQQTHARHILMSPDEITNDDQTRKKMQTIKKRLDKGEDFAKLAEEFSQDPGSKNNGGDLGWSTEGSFVPRFEKVMNSLKLQQTSEPFRSQFGWHIIQVLDRRKQDESTQLLESKARKALHKRKSDEELQLWLRRIRDESYVEYVNAN